MPGVQKKDICSGVPRAILSLSIFSGRTVATIWAKLVVHASIGICLEEYQNNYSFHKKPDVHASAFKICQESAKS